MPDTNRTRYFDMTDSLLEFLASEWRKQITLHAKAERPSGFYIKTAPIFYKEYSYPAAINSRLLGCLDIKSMSPHVKIMVHRLNESIIVIEIDDRHQP